MWSAKPLANPIQFQWKCSSMYDWWTIAASRSSSASSYGSDISWLCAIRYFWKSPYHRCGHDRSGKKSVLRNVRCNRKCYGWFSRIFLDERLYYQHMQQIRCDLKESKWSFHSFRLHDAI